jgi:hypothetical protein
MRITGIKALQYAREVKAIKAMPRVSRPSIWRAAELERQVERLKAEIRKLRCLPGGSHETPPRA